MLQQQQQRCEKLREWQVAFTLGGIGRCIGKAKAAAAVKVDNCR